jgi:hypothetical protein
MLERRREIILIHVNGDILLSVAKAYRKLPRWLAPALKAAFTS